MQLHDYVSVLQGCVPSAACAIASIVVATIVVARLSKGPKVSKERNDPF